MLIVQMGLRLIIEDYEGSTTVFPLGDGAITIGREEGNTIRLTEKNISRQHLRLVPADQGWVIEDLRSYNGVRVNGEVLDSGSSIHEGDLIQIGDYQLLIGDETSTRATMDLGPELVAAANDKGGSLAAALAAGVASADLPTRRPEAVTMDDGPGGARAPGLLVGPAAVPTDDDFDKVAGTGGGAKIFVALLLLGGLGFGAWYQFGRGESGASRAAAANAANTAGNQGAAQADPPTGDAAAAADETLGGIADETSGTQDAVGEDPLIEDPVVEDPIVEDPVVEDPVVEDPVVEDPVVEDPAVADPTPVKKKKRKKKKAAAPTQSAEELLAAARSAQISKSYAKAYSLAKKSYAAKASPSAAKVMGVAACKLGDAAKAKSAYGKLSGSNKSALKSVCASSGIDL